MQQQQGRPGAPGAPGQKQAASSAAPPTVSSTLSSTAGYSQPIDLTTLLQKPTTQSSISTTQHQTSLLQFSQQAATDSLKAAVGISTTKDNSAGKEYGGFGSTAPAPTAATAGSYSSAASSYVAAASTKPQQQQQPSAFSAIAKTNGDVGMNQGQQPNAARGRMPPQSQQQQKQNPAVEMPGDSLGRLDVQFGGLDLQFGGQTAAAPSSDNTNGGSSSANTTTGGYDFNGTSAGSQSVTASQQQQQPESVSVDNKYLGDKSSKDSKDYIGAPPTAKEVNKSLSSAIIPGQSTTGSKLNSSDGYASQDVRKQQQQQTGSQQNYRQGKNDENIYSSTYNPYSNQQGNYKGSYGQGQQYHNQYGSGYTNGGSATSYGSQYGSSNRSTGDNYYNSQQQGYGKPPSSASTTQSSGGNQYGDKFSSHADSPSGSNAAATGASLGSGTSTTNALSGKVSASSASEFRGDLC